MPTLDEVKARSAPAIANLNTTVKYAAEQLVERCYRRGVNIRITDGLRTFSEQDELYAQGRTSPGSIVTNAKAGYSFHNFGLAIDFVLISSGYDMKADVDGDGTADWSEVVEVAKELGFAWGGDWKSFKDNPHFEMTFGLTCAQLRAGKTPSDAKLKAARAKIDAGLIKEEDQEMTAAEKKAFEDLQATVKSQQTVIDAQAKKVAKLESLSSMETPSWAKEAVTAAVAHKLVDEKSAQGSSYDFYRILTVIHRGGFTK